ncbi:MFS transporter [Dactylosporangium matsuzakiense]|uniref:Cyanate transporter n=1 Tax=Dactylosporangium matsuzakiense TaxID=53360 RepID=A0A9W6KRB5_9ACTN|nr:MFS transporter [Dactylosporangium matsuzakiense]UWZ42611.1 MFS transporter [Dactylosporangium matsuzakiense]GLL06173.1 cyanate transporter [Dactylosporangium matsuzakiense]
MTITEPRADARALSPALVLAGLLLVAGNLRAGITTVGPVLDELRRDLGLSSLTASALISLPLIAFAVVSPFAPALARRTGIERALGGGLVVLAAGLVVRSLPGLPLLWLGTALLGVAVAVLNVVLPALVKRDFPGRIGQVTGAYSVVQSVFAATAAGVAVPVAGLTAAGWRLPLGMWAGLALIALAVLAPQLRRRTVAPEPARIRRHRPRRSGQDRSPAAPAPAAGRSPWRTALGWQVTAFMALQSIGYYILITWLPSIEKAAGIDATAAGVHQLLLNGFGIAGSIGCSTLIARLRDQRPLGVLTPVLYGIAVTGILTAPQYSAVWSSLAGVAGGFGIVLALSFFGLRTGHHTQAAALSGMAQAVGYVVAAAGPIAAGALHDATGSWAPALLTVVGLDAVLIVFGYLAGRSRTIG